MTTNYVNSLDHQTQHAQEFSGVLEFFECAEHYLTKHHQHRDHWGCENKFYGHFANFWIQEVGHEAWFPEVNVETPKQ